MGKCLWGGHISMTLDKHGYNVESTDIVDRGYEKFSGVKDFLSCKDTEIDKDIITNPPYNKAKEFVEKSLDVVSNGHKVAMFLKLTFLESKGRKELFEKYPPEKVYVFRERAKCAMNGDEKEFNKSSAVCYAWFIWRKGFTGDPIIKWL